MMTKDRLIALVVGLAAFAPSYAGAQDIFPAQVPGRELSPEYVERLRLKAETLRQSSGWVLRAQRAIGASQPVTGDLPFVAIPALFSDSPDPVYGSDDLSRTLFDGPAEDGTLIEFYTEVSGGRLGIYGEVGPWVQTSLTLAQVVGSEYGLGDDARTGEYMVEALSLVDGSIDFSLYDNDGPDNVPNSGDDDGYVDAIAFYFPAISASCGGPGIWPHFWGISGWPDQEEFVTDDAQTGGGFVKIDAYFIQSIVSCDGTDITPITTVAHELGHNLGLPDLYHAVYGILPEQRRWVVGCWSLMAAGAWGCGTMNRNAWRRPTHMGAWEKRFMGWLDEIVVVPQAELLEVTLPPVRTSGEILEIPLGVDERLLVEYRERNGFDLGIPAAGVLIYRINDTVPFRPCAECVPIYRVNLVEADGDSTLVKTFPQGGNRGEAGDAFGALGAGTLTTATEPSTRLDGGFGASSRVNIYEVTVENGFAHLVLSTMPIAVERVLGPFLLDDLNELTDLEEAYLDDLNNQNGRYDVGDLRAYLQRGRPE
jgi:M6 family metalloprotease-like protein